MSAQGLCRDFKLQTTQRARGTAVVGRCHVGRTPFVSYSNAPRAHRGSAEGAAPAARRFPVCRAAAVLDEAPASPVPTLAELSLCSVINTQGIVLPETPEGAVGYTYAIYDEKQKLQYVGTTTDIRNALRTALGRRPEKTHYYKVTSLPTGEPAALQAIRDAWFSECGGQPNGNRLAMERNMWQQPVDAGAISERGRRGAAESCANTLIAALRDRGCKEVFTPIAALLNEGQVDFMPALNLSDEEIAKEREAEADRMRGRRSCSALVDGMERIFHTSYVLKVPTNGGFMFDVSVLFDGRETNHRVIVGKQYYEPYGLAPEAAVEAGLALLLRAKVARATEGMLLSSQFPVNYFALGQVEQWYGEEFRNEFQRITGGVNLQTNEADAWRFNRIHDYGPMRNETPEQLSAALGQQGAARSEAATAVDAIFSSPPPEGEEEELPKGKGILDAFF